jgi:hypothetical protein
MNSKIRIVVTTIYGRCQVCGREVQTYVPKQGNGTLRLCRPHRDVNGYRCIGGGMASPEVPTSDWREVRRMVTL